MRQSISTFQILGCLLAALFSKVEAVCLLCEEGNYGLQYPNAVIKSDGTTCATMAVDVAVDYSEGSEQCVEHIQAWRPICCGDEKPIDVEVTEVFDEYPDIDSIQTIGPYDKCDVCRDGEYPSASSMVITMLYVGSGSCTQFWKAGQQGLIPTHLCDPLQYFAYEPCGCGEFSTNGNFDWGNSKNDDNDAWWTGADSLGEDDLWWEGADSNVSVGQGPKGVWLASTVALFGAAILVF